MYKIYINGVLLESTQNKWHAVAVVDRLEKANIKASTVKDNKIIYKTK